MTQTIYLAGGCFWGVEAYFKNIDGIIDTEVGYANGLSEETSYNDLKRTDHAETVEVKFDENKISLEKILDYLFYIIDPYSVNRQGNDIGRQYRTGIYSKDEEILKEVEAYVENKQKETDKEIQVEVENLKNFIIAEEYHQDYLDKNPTGYCHVNLNDIPKL